MTTIITRAGKNAPLSNTEVDQNFLSLNTDKLEAATTATLTNKTIALGSNTVSGTTAQFNTALTDGDFATLAGSETLTNKTLGSGTVDNTTTLVSRADIGTAPNEIPLNGMLGSMAYQDATSVSVGSLVSSGNVGVGTSAPSYLLDVNGTAQATTYRIRSGGYITDGAGNVTVNPSSVGSLAITSNGSFTNGNIVYNALAASGIHVWQGNSTERMRLDASGNLGIGTSSPTPITAGSRVLEVSGAGDFFPSINLTRTGASGYTNVNWKQFLSSDGGLYFRQNSTDRMVIDASGNLGLGVTPSAWGGATALQVKTLSMWSTGGNNGLWSSNVYYNGTSRTYIGTATATEYQQSGGQHLWYSAPSGTAGAAITFTQVLAVEKDKSLALQGATSQAGAGISFPATQVASSDANTLDDYEEGTFTPTIVGTTTAGTGTYTLQNGRYTKIGNKVSFTIHISWTAHTGTGNMAVGSMPFTSVNITNADASVCLGYVNNVTLTASNVMTAAIPGNSSQILLYQTPVGGGSASSVPVDTAAQILISGFYFV